MALSKRFFLGFAIGFGTGAVMRDYLPQVREAISPLMKMSLKSLILLSEKSREMTLRTVEGLQDWVAETVDELKQSRESSREQPETTAKGKRAHRRAHGAESVKPDEKESEKEKAKIVSLRERKEAR
jgi:hypothetical protein